MSSNIRVQKVCEYCGREFEARKTTSKTCSDHCAKMNYKAKQRTTKIGVASVATRNIMTRSIEEVKAKEFLTVKDVARLLNFSIRTTYRMIEQGNIKAVNLSERKTLIKRSDIDKLFS